MSSSRVCDFESISLLITDPGREIHYQPVFDYFRRSGLLVNLFNPTNDWERHNIDLALTSCEYNSTSSVQIAKANSLGIPTLHIVDGIAEWRNTWENPRSESEDRGMPLFQPILSDKVACIGPSQGRLFSSWGQANKVEITGLPRLDYLYYARQTVERHKRPSYDSPLILIATARSPGFTQGQTERVRASLQDLNDYLHELSRSKSLSVLWRVGLPEILPKNLFGQISDESEQPVSEILNIISALITTPSTLALESMALKVPTCILDYTNSPQYLLSGWRISSKDHIKDELASLLSASPKRLAYQEYVFYDQFRIDSPSSSIVANLIADMIALSRDSGAKRSRLIYPPSMAKRCTYQSSIEWDPSSLFPAHPVFARGECDEIRCELGHLRLVLNQKDLEIQRLLKPSPISLFVPKLSRFLGKLVSILKYK